MMKTNYEKFLEESKEEALKFELKHTAGAGLIDSRALRELFLKIKELEYNFEERLKDLEHPDMWD